MKRVLDVGGHDRSMPLPVHFQGFERVLLDIDPEAAPDILCDARQLTNLSAGSFDAVYCSHNLEHYYSHDVPRVLTGFLHVLRDGGFAQIVVPDLGGVMRHVVEKGLDIEDPVVQSPTRPITVLEVLYGDSLEIARSSHDFFAHKTGFTEKSLLKVLRETGFGKLYAASANLQLDVLAFKTGPDSRLRALFGLPEE